jgi:hypothetical protein
LKVETALWLFVEVENLEPTNNSAERAIRILLAKAIIMVIERNPRRLFST